MDLERTERFRKAYRRLTTEEQRQVNTSLRLLAENPRHPGLQARRWSRSDMWYARVSSDMRIFYEIHEGFFLLIDVGHHDIERAH